MEDRPGDDARRDAHPAPAARSGRIGGTIAGRYRLDQPQPADLPGAERWDATDQILARSVSVTLLSGPRTGAAVDGARRAALVVDPRLARILDVGTADGLGYVVTEAAEGRTLAALTARAPLPADQARAVIGEAAAALEAARRRGVHHLALRPSALRVTSAGRVVLDGLAVDGELLGATSGSAHATSRADTLGLVRLLYAALTGRWPHLAATGPGGTGTVGVPSFAEWSSRESAPSVPGPAADGFEAGLPAAPDADGTPVPPGDLVGAVPADLDTLCTVTLGPHDDGPHSPGELVRELEPWRAVRADAIYQAADAGRWPAMGRAAGGADAEGGAGGGVAWGAVGGAVAGGVAAGGGAVAAGAVAGAAAGAGGSVPEVVPGAGAGATAGAAAGGTAAGTASVGAEATALAGATAAPHAPGPPSADAPSDPVPTPGTEAPTASTAPDDAQDEAAPPSSRPTTPTAPEPTAAATVPEPTAARTVPEATAASAEPEASTADVPALPPTAPSPSPTVQRRPALRPTAGTSPEVSPWPAPDATAPAAPPVTAPMSAEHVPPTATPEPPADPTSGPAAPEPEPPAPAAAPSAPTSREPAPVAARSAETSTAPSTGSDPMTDDSQRSTPEPDEGATAAPAEATGVARQSVRSAFDRDDRPGARRPGTPPPATPAPASFPPAQAPAPTAPVRASTRAGGAVPPTIPPVAAPPGPAAGPAATTALPATSQPPTGRPGAPSQSQAAAPAGPPPSTPGWDLPFQGEQPRRSDGQRRFDPTRWVLGIVALAVVVGVVVALSNVLAPWRSSSDDSAAGSTPAVTPTAAATEAPATDGGGDADAGGAAAVVAPQIAAVSSIDPSDGDGEHEELVGRLTDGDPATAWYTHTYNRPDYAGFKEAVGLVITLTEPATVTSVTLDVNGSGGNVEVRATDAANPTAGDILASGPLNGQTVLTLTQPTQTQSIVLWFTELSQTSDGQNRIEITNLAVS